MVTGPDDSHGHQLHSENVTELVVRERKGVSLLLLNLKRLITVLMKQLTRAMGVPTAASGDDLWQPISGKLEEQGRKPMNVQVVLKEVEGGMHLSLQDEDGGLLEAAPPTPDELPDEMSGEESSVDGGSGEEEIARLREALIKSEEENVALQADLES